MSIFGAHHHPPTESVAHPLSNQSLPSSVMALVASLASISADFSLGFPLFKLPVETVRWLPIETILCLPVETVLCLPVETVFTVLVCAAEGAFFLNCAVAVLGVSLLVFFSDQFSVSLFGSSYYTSISIGGTLIQTCALIL